MAASALLAAAACGGEESKLTGYQLELPNVGDLILRDATHGDGPVALRAQSGGLLIVFLGFTNCPDVCPTTMASIGRAVGRTDAELVEVAMVTVDPEHDTSEVLTQFVRQFVEDGRALRPATSADLDELVTDLGAAYEIADHQEHGSGPAQVGHTSYAYVFDDAGDVALVWTSEMTADDIAKDLELLQEQLYDT